MSRYRNSSGGGVSGSSMMAVSVIRSKQDEYRGVIKSNQAMSSMLAETIAVGGELETTMLEAAGDNEQLKQEVHGLLQQQRERLKKVSEKNVMTNRSIDVFLSSLQEMHQGLLQQENPDADYEKLLDQSMRKHAAARKELDVELHEEDYCREIRSKLNEKEPKKKKSKTSARQQGNDDDSDDDLEVVNLPTVSEQSLKCPITGKLFEDPVKHKVCKHTYSRTGFEQLLRSSGNRRCPVPGCSTHSITMDQVEKDEQMEMKVRKYKRRKDRERQQRMTQEVDSDDEDVL